MKKVALITGASSGIGYALAKYFVETGYELALVSRRMESLLEFGDCKYEVDLASGVDELLSQFKRDFERVDVLVNSAGVLPRGMFDLSPAEMEYTLRLNLQAPFALMQGVIPMMEEQGSGHIFNVSSRSGKVGFPAAGVYCASKFGLSGLNEATYRKYSEKGIKVTALCPSWVDTPMADVGGCKLPKNERIPCDDLVRTVDWLLGLSPASCVKEVMIECATAVH